MTTDLDDLLRQSLRRHAEDAPRVVDTERVHARAAAITRRRRLEAATAVLTTLALVLGAGYATTRLRTDAVPVDPAPVSLGWNAFFRFDQNAGQQGEAQLLVRTSGSATNVASAGLYGSEVIGWYGPGHRTLVYRQGNDGSSQQTTLPIMAVPFNEDGSQAKAAAPLDVSVVAGLTGISYPLPSGFAVWRPTGSSPYQGELITVDDALSDAVATPLPEGRPLVVTPSVVALGMPDRATLTLFATADATTTTVPACAAMNRSAVAPDGVHAAVACGDGSVVIVDLASRTSVRTPAIPGAATAPSDASGPSGAILGLWYDPTLGLHASMTPSVSANYTEVRDFGWSGSSWTAEGTGVIERVYPAGSPPLRLERLARDGVDAYNSGRWIAEQTTDTDLGPAVGPIAVRAAAQESPSPAPSTTVPPAPATPAWTASLAEVPGSAPPATVIEVRVGANVQRLDQIDNSAAGLAGWTGLGRRTLVWGASQDYPGDQALYSAELSPDGSVASPAAPLKAPDGTAITGRAFVLADGRLVVWQRTAVNGQQVTGRMLRFSADLTTATTQTLPPGDPIFATSQYVGLQDTSRGSTLDVVGSKDSGSVMLASCAEGYRASVSPDEQFAALSCRDAELDVVYLPTIALGDASGVTPLGVPRNGTAIATWWTPNGELVASSFDPVTSPSTVRTSIWNPSTPSAFDWVDAKQQDVVYRYHLDGYSIVLHGPGAIGGASTGGEWRTETDPSVSLGIGYYADQWGPSLVVRPAG